MKDKSSNDKIKNIDLMNKEEYEIHNNMLVKIAV